MMRLVVFMVYMMDTLPVKMRTNPIWVSPAINYGYNYSVCILILIKYRVWKFSTQ